MSATILEARPAAPMPAPSDTVLEVRDLVTHFPTRAGVVKAVDGVSFTLRRGRTLCVVGESGSGKSVTARSILQIVDAPGRIVGGSMVLHRPDGSSVDLAKLHPRSRQIRAVLQIDDARFDPATLHKALRCAVNPGSKYLGIHNAID